VIPVNAKKSAIAAWVIADFTHCLKGVGGCNGSSVTTRRSRPATLA
jgi:hypothetical protein